MEKSIDSIKVERKTKIIYRNCYFLIEYPFFLNNSIAFSILLEFILKVSELTKTGVAPSKETISPGVKKMKSRIKASSLEPIPQAIKTSLNASVHYISTRNTMFNSNI